MFSSFTFFAFKTTKQNVKTNFAQTNKQHAIPLYVRNLCVLLVDVNSKRCRGLDMLMTICSVRMNDLKR